MKRTVKAWGVLFRVNVGNEDELRLSLVAHARAEDASARCVMPGEKAVAVTLTYDDGKPAPKRRKGGK